MFRGIYNSLYYLILHFSLSPLHFSTPLYY